MFLVAVAHVGGVVAKTMVLESDFFHKYARHVACLPMTTIIAVGRGDDDGGSAVADVALTSLPTTEACVWVVPPVAKVYRYHTHIRSQE